MGPAACACHQQTSETAQHATVPAPVLPAASKSKSSHQPHGSQSGSLGASARGTNGYTNGRTNGPSWPSRPRCRVSVATHRSSWHPPPTACHVHPRTQCIRAHASTLQRRGAGWSAREPACAGLRGILLRRSPPQGRLAASTSAAPAAVAAPLQWVTHVHQHRLPCSG